ncbi:MAG: superoxide dismutase family protein [Leptolyngbyaceae cyanobacterium SM1_1_3]|nr:superoxide dismutase family protein [Leptolyngbyaceae cyanobacterium SM1_1_3]NJN01222.1 superoxide dismutase family protein [Leptolyngbyaceae cyanobacterium RM1_1_2]NJO09064.1 superoxide dismutase family protein [Leptolyngbyaceae cyanobacterium SL_1_1]
MNLFYCGLILKSCKKILPKLANFIFANRAVILHADADDFGQPTGHVGDRIGCGVIQLGLAQ